MATFAIGDEGGRDEIKNYQTGRYILSNEAIWRIFGLEIRQRYPAVVNLAVHLENGQSMRHWGYSSLFNTGNTWN